MKNNNLFLISPHGVWDSINLDYVGTEEKIPDLVQKELSLFGRILKRDSIKIDLVNNKVSFIYEDQLSRLDEDEYSLVPITLIQ